MNKTAIKNFAVWARNKLIADITYKAGLLGITDKQIKSPLPQSTSGVQFFDIGTREPYSITGIEIEQRRNLAEVIENKARQSDYQTARNSVIEEVAYTWFNRLIAVRFMEVNDYLPSRTRVLSSESPTKNEPDIVTSPFDSELDFAALEREHILHLKNENQLDVLFRMLFIKQCNTLNEVLPELFEKTNDYTELLLNVSYTDKDGVVYHLIHDISEHDFNVEKEGQVEIIGWMYQYYNTEPKDETFALLKKNIKITKEHIPAATQLFTPDWIVRYMVENSLGRLWIDGHPNDDLKANWKYYLDEAEQEPKVQIKLDAIREKYKSIKPEDIKVIDPCMGSGHILVYAFDVLMQIYESYGYSQRDAAKSIVENNLYGLDIDNRSYQLTYFAVMMKARQYNRRILNGGIHFNIYAIQESNEITREQLKYFGVSMDDLERNTALSQMEYLLDTMYDAKEYGSILNIDDLNWELLYKFIADREYEGQVTSEMIGLDDTQRKLWKLARIAAAMVRKYDVVVTNPPYMSGRSVGEKLSDYLQVNYPNSKTDMFAVFIERCSSMCVTNGFFAMITQHSFMFLSSFEEMRERYLKLNLINMLHLGIKAFEEIKNDVVQTTTFVNRNTEMNGFYSTYCRLVDCKDQKLKEEIFLKKTNLFIASNKNFFSIPGSPMAYWVSENFINSFSSSKPLEHFVTISASLNKTGDNDRFVRYWWEVNVKKINDKWRFYAKGGDFRRYYGNLEVVVDWSYSAREYYRSNKTSNLLNKDFWFKKGITYSAVTSRGTGFRYLPEGCVFDMGGPAIIVSEMEERILGLLNSSVATYYFSVFNPTINLQTKDIRMLPAKIESLSEVEIPAKENIQLSAKDWDSLETSADFTQIYGLNSNNKYLSNAYEKCCNNAIEERALFAQNMIQINEIVANTYGLTGEVGTDIEERDIAIKVPNLTQWLRRLISYAVGCMFGRYSLDVDGLAYAGGEWDNSKYSNFIPDQDNIIPITDEEYFEDDVVGMFCAFLKKSFSAETLEENLDFTAKALGNKGNTSREVIRNYFLKDFFKDHCKIYQKRPIYWLFDSGKADGFKALVYMHRYDANTIGNLRIDYLHRMQRVYDNEIARMQETIDNSGNAREAAAATKRKEKLIKQLKETKEYDEKIAHLALARISIDLDDGVKVNYDKVQMDNAGNKLDVLAKI
ncbi:BREX-1 system adenine-specific DNA-methyltransferase PglX [Paenibacillus odorifer]|uniref:BREX-1 system adenine-specific DNA-methyltransferase PglX n=1 Tax=Paenibacillus odorifer TaxID=189426 RepID=UPI0028A1DFB5|nr:BREX-1 system adenine-specific DNA-methyltransferase PglX [Paenibacillus odorifer]